MTSVILYELLVNYYMGTKNPKVSAYVPQVLKDRLDEFIKQRNNIPESQAVNIILAEYFGMTEVLNRSPQGGRGVTLDRMEALEKKLADFSESVEHRLQEIGEAIGKLGELSVNREVVQQEHWADEQSSGLLSEPNSSLQKDGLGVQERSDTVENELSTNGKPQENQITEYTNSLLSELPGDNTNHSQIPLILDVEESDKQTIRIDADLLARRVGLKMGSLKNKRSQLSDQEFTEWSTTKDDDGIGWRAVKEGKRVYYEPTMPIEDELLSKLLEWIRKNRT
jgi:hypothetical protein